MSISRAFWVNNKNMNKTKIGSRIRICLPNGTLDPVVYTVKGFKSGCALVAHGWGIFRIKSWVKQP
jgi:hypothetical protein